jgi:tetratricopeptide (TPR) repeat protein
MGKPQEAMALYQESLATIQALGDVRAIAVTQANLGQFLLQEGEAARALALLWEAFMTLERTGYAADAQTMRQLLAQVKTQVLGSESFDALWSAVVGSGQPGWLVNLQTQPGFSPADNRQAAIMTAVRAFVGAESWAASRAVVETHQELLFDPAVAGIFQSNIAQAQANGDDRATSYLQRHLDLLLACRRVGVDAAFDALEQAGTGSEELNEELEDETDGVDANLMTAVQRFVAANDLAAKRQIVEEAGALLTSPAADAIFAQNIQQAQRSGEGQWGAALAFHRDLLAACRSQGVAAAFAAAERQMRQALPFDPQLIQAAVSALTGSPQQRLTLLQTVMTQAQQSSDRDLLAFYRALQTALVGGNVAEAGRGLTGLYAQAWAALLAELSGGLQGFLAAAIQNTLTVLGPAAAQRLAWRGNLTTLRQRADGVGDADLTAFAAALIALLDADGNPAGLGAGLVAPYADAWQAILTRLAES